MVGAIKRKTKLAGRVKGVGGKIKKKAVQARPSREGRVGAPGAHKVEGKFGMGEKAVPEVSGKVGMGGGEG